MSTPPGTPPARRPRRPSPEADTTEALPPRPGPWLQRWAVDAAVRLAVSAAALLLPVRAPAGLFNVEVRLTGAGGERARTDDVPMQRCCRISRAAPLLHPLTQALILALLPLALPLPLYHHVGAQAAALGLALTRMRTLANLLAEQPDNGAGCARFVSQARLALAVVVPGAFDLPPHQTPAEACWIGLAFQLILLGFVVPTMLAAAVQQHSQRKLPERQPPVPATARAAGRPPRPPTAGQRRAAPAPRANSLASALASALDLPAVQLAALLGHYLFLLPAVAALVWAALEATSAHS